MQAIIHSIVEKTGLTEAQAKSALETALGAIKTKLPASVANQLDGLLNGQAFDFKAVAGEKLNELKDDAQEKLHDLKEEATEKLDDLKEGFKKMF